MLSSNGRKSVAPLADALRHRSSQKGFARNFVVASTNHWLLSSKKLTPIYTLNSEISRNDSTPHTRHDLTDIRAKRIYHTLSASRKEKTTQVLVITNSVFLKSKRPELFFGTILLRPLSSKSSGNDDKNANNITEEVGEKMATTVVPDDEKSTDTSSETTLKTERKTTQFIPYSIPALDFDAIVSSDASKQPSLSDTPRTSDTTTKPNLPKPPPSSVPISSTPDEWGDLNDHNVPLRSSKELNEGYRHIERDQQTSLDKSRAKRALTVRRALAGNLVITSFKLAAFLSSGSSAMMSEFIHSVVDSGNQMLLLVGLHDSGNAADRKHPYGYGKSIYFWALVSALGTFFLGAGVSMTQAIPELIHGPSLHEITWHVWGVLGISFVVDGYVLTKTIAEVKETMPKESSFWKHVWTVRDPATLAILLEDGAACLGIVMAIAGIVATHATGMPVFDALAGVGISGLLAGMGVALVRVNHRFLLGQAVDQEIIKGIEKILLTRRSIDHVHSVQSQWTGPETFSYKAEVDFDGTFLAAKLMPRYQQEFHEARSTLDQDLRVLLSWYAEDVMRAVEREVRHIESEIRKEYPGAAFIELEPMSKDADRFAIDDGMEAQLKRIEIEALNRYLKSLYQVDKSTKRRTVQIKPDRKDRGAGEGSKTE